MGGGDSGDWYSKRAAGYVIQADGLEELDGEGVAAVFSADAVLDIAVCLAAVPDGLLDQDSHSGPVQGYERVAEEDFVFQISAQEF